MLQVVVSGLVTGWAIAIPIGAVGAFLVSLSARTSWRVASAAALGVASVDGAYAGLAVTAGTTVAAAFAPVSDYMRITSASALLLVSGLTLLHALRSAMSQREAHPLRPAAAYWVFVALTAVNPTTILYFVAIVLGNRDLVSSAPAGVVFVVAAFAASASWQLLLAGSGAALARTFTSPRGRKATGVLSSLLIALLAIHTLTV